MSTTVADIFRPRRPAAEPATKRMELRPDPDPEQKVLKLTPEQQALMDEFAALPDDGEVLLKALLALPRRLAEVQGEAWDEEGPGFDAAVPGSELADAVAAGVTESFGVAVSEKGFTVSEQDTRSVFVPNCPRGATQDQLKALFSEVGKVLRVTVRPVHGKKICTAVVEYSTKEEAKAAIPAMHRRLLSGQQISVMEKRSRG